MGRVVLELVHLAVLTVEKHHMYRECWQGSVLGNGGLKSPSGQGGIALNRAFVRSLFVARLSEGLMACVVEMQRGRPLELRPHLLLMVGDCGAWWNDTLCKLKYRAVRRPKCHCTHHKSHISSITFGSPRGEPAAYCMRVLSLCVYVRTRTLDRTVYTYCIGPWSS
jgi:hypothetical protein